MLEFLGRFVVDVLLQGLLEALGVAAHAVTRLVVPTLTGGRVKVEPRMRPRVLVRRWHGVHRLTDGTPVIGVGLAELIGIVLIIVAVAAIIVIVKYV